MVMIIFDRVSFGYPAAKSTPVVHDLSFVLKGGEEVAVMGANGCGKTTLGLLLAGIIKPDSGTITIQADEHDVEEKAARPAIGFLFQDPDNGLVATTVEREVAFSLENQNRPASDMRPVVDRTLDYFGMTRLRERSVWNLSGGEKQRLSLAGLFAYGPKILFLDEPGSFLDYPGVKQLEDGLRRFKTGDPSLTIIRVTQYAHVADRYPRLFLMADGRIIRDDAPSRIFSDPGLLAGCRLRSPLRYLTPAREPSQVAPEPPKAEATEHPLVTIEDLHFAYEPDESDAIFRELSLTIRKGEVIGLIGPSGCGKSTLAQILCGIYRPTGGRVRFADPSSRAVMSFQQAERQFFCDTVHDEIAYGISRDGKSDTAIGESVRTSMSMVGLDFESFKGRDPHTLSGGEARRLAFAIVVALPADLIIFDEPTCGLDEAGIGAFKKLVRWLNQAGKTIMIISHNSNIIADLADRVALLQDGRITETASAKTFFSMPEYKAILSTPEAIEYQLDNYGAVTTARAEDMFDRRHFYS